MDPALRSWAEVWRTALWPGIANLNRLCPNSIRILNLQTLASQLLDGPKEKGDGGGLRIWDWTCGIESKAGPSTRFHGYAGTRSLRSG